MSLLEDLFSTTPAGMNDTATALEVGGKVFSGLQHIQYGRQAREAADFQAAQLKQNASDAQAAAQREAYDIDRQAQFVASSALAHAAASGGGASDPTVLNLIAKNAGEMAYRQQVALYQGQDKARLLNMQAEAKQYEGRINESNAIQVGIGNFVGAGASLLKGAEKSSMLKKYGNGGPNTQGITPAPKFGWFD